MKHLVIQGSHVQILHLSNDCCSHKQQSVEGFLGLFPSDEQSHIRFLKFDQAWSGNDISGIYWLCKSYLFSKIRYQL